MKLEMATYEIGNDNLQKKSNLTLNIVFGDLIFHSSDYLSLIFSNLISSIV